MKGSISLRLYPHDTDAVAQVAELRAQARLGLEAGYDGLMVSEHHADFPGYLPNPIQLTALLLAATDRGWVAPCPLVLPLQPYAFVAEQLAWMAAAYPDRVAAGFAAGALPVDFELAEVPFEEMRDRFVEALPRIVAALRGHDPGPVGRDRALRRCSDHPIPMVVAAQSLAAVRRAAMLGCGVLYDSLQRNDVSRRLSDTYRAAGGDAGTVLIRRVWIGDPPTDEMAAQMAHYRSYAPEQAIANWSPGSESLICGVDGDEAAARLLECLDESGCDTVNVRIHVKGVTADQVRRQLERHAIEFLPALRRSGFFGGC